MTVYDYLVCAGVAVVLAGWFTVQQRHWLAWQLRRWNCERRWRRDMHRAAQLRAAQKASADRMGAGLWVQR